ncbi:MAG TPA: glycosyltransferase family 39 protein [Gemmatimonadales bacterium]|nr:glycosyltransferase family 39 protein [Gemmatimonadales bacterium]
MDHPHPKLSAYARLPLLVLAAALALGFDLGGHRLLDPDEGRNAEVAREMAESNQYLLPHLDGLPYLDKPVVYFAAAAAIMEVLDATETAARLPAYLATLATIAIVVRFARRRWGPDAGWLAGLALGTMPLVMAYARATIFDSTLSFCTTAAILAFWDERPVIAWAAIGLGALTKGPVAILVPLAALVPAFWLTGRPLRRLFPWLGLAVFAAVALPWFLAVSARIPEFPRYVFVRETLQRVTTAAFHRTAPAWYYLPIVPVAAFPWIVPALAHLKHWRWAWLARRVNASAQEAIYLTCWVLAPLAFFTLNQSKLPQYVLPLMPAFALAAARILARDGIGVAWRSYVAAAAALGLALGSLRLWLPAPIALTPAQRAAVPGTALALGVALVVSATVVWLAVRLRRPTLGASGYALVVMAIPLVTGPLLDAVGDDRSAATLASVIRNARPGNSAVLGISAFPPSLPFYLRRPIDVATETGRELTSNFIADQVERFRAVPGSPLKPAGSWREVLARCRAPTVFITRTGDQATRAALERALPVLAVEGRYAAYGPCLPVRSPSPQRGEGVRG